MAFLPPAGRGTTAAAARTTAGSRPGAQQEPAPARAACAWSRRLASASTVGASNRLRIASSTSRVARMRLISRVASSECPPSSKKLSSMPTRSTPQHLGEQPAQDLLLRRARRTARRRGVQLRRRQRAAVELAVRRQRQPLQHHERRRHHVVRQARRNMRPQRRRIGARAARSPPHRRPAACRRADPRARSPPPAPRRDAASAPPRSRPARCGSRGSSPARRRGRGSPAPRRRASAPGRRCGTSGCRPAQRVGHEPLRGQPGAAQIAARQTRARDVELARDARRHRLQAVVQHIDPRSSQIGRPIGTCAPDCSPSTAKAIASMRGLGRAVEIDDAARPRGGARSPAQARP